MTPLFIGLDLGGSGTRAALVDAAGQLLASGQGGPSGQDGRATGRRALRHALDAALAPIAPLVVGEACVISAGMRGLSIPGRRESLAVELSSRFPEARARISNDALIALWAGLAGDVGVAVLAGTGSIALARSADGREGRAGGWGYLLGDEGSGFWLGREAVALLLRVLEGGAAPGPLSDLVRQAMQRRIESAPDAIAWLYAGSDQVARLGELAPLVARAAAAGDTRAEQLLCRAGRSLAGLVVAAARQLWPTGTPQPLRVACCGGVWAAGAPLWVPFAEALAAELPAATPSPALLPPVAGALLLAMSADQQPLPSTVRDTLLASVQALGRTV
jgi:N-acetylglucosamine kinase-like BadF-type ATPase